MRESVESIITGWALDHNKRFEFDKRVEACIDLFTRMETAGYDGFEIKGTKVKTLALARMVGHKSKMGTAGLKRWKAAAEEDFNDAFHMFFKPKEGEAPETEFATELVEEAAPPAPVAPVYKKEIRTQTTDISLEEPEDDWRAKFRDSVETTPVEDAEEFMARMGLK